jgi:hypothetical protein
MARELHRGLHFGDYSEEEVRGVMKDPHRFLHENLNRQQMGIHWTANVNSAYNFATNRDPEGWAHEGDPFEEDEGEPFGVVMSARVHPRHVVEPGTEEHESYSFGSAILHEEHPEQETTVREGGRVHSREMHFFHGSEHVGSIKGRWSGKA